ncbi:MAG: NADH-quinone oxidoreductase subunit NuoE [Candidatus Krumholzibacteriia bacterium]
MSEQVEMHSEEPFAFNEETERKFQETLGKYPTKMAVLLPALWLAQEQNGYLPDSALEYVAGRLELSPVHVFSVVEFYTMYHRKPPGRYHIQMCRTLSCTLCHMEDLEAHLAERHGIRAGEKTEDGMFSLELVECLGSCGTAPVMRVNDVYCENLDPDKVDRIIESCKAGAQLEEDPMQPN